MHHRVTAFLFWISIVCCTTPVALSGDWPSWQHDSQRSGSTTEKIEVESLGLAWQWRSPFRPQPAWAGPAKWDAYAGLTGLPSMRNYDAAFQLIAYRDTVIFGSSIDDTVYCLDAASGAERWSFVTDGPVRIAPCAVDGKIYFGSDDGYAYCLNASDGALVWKYRPADPGPKIINNGRLIPLYPCRTGVLVEDGIAYFACGMLPWRDSHLCAVNADTGRIDRAGCFVEQLKNKTLEGAPALTADSLVFPQGRVAPQLYRRSDGQDQGQLKGSGGGSIVVVSLDSTVLHGPATDSRRGGIRSSDPKTREAVASYGRGKALVVAEHNAYMLTDNQLVASDLRKRETKWTVPCDCPNSLIASGTALFAGGADQIAAFAIQDGRRLWTRAVDGRVFSMALAGGRLFASTDTGAVYAFAEGSDVERVEAGVAGTTSEKTSLPQFTHDGLRGRWVLQQAALKGRRVQDLAGQQDGVVQSPARFQELGQRQALIFDGNAQSVQLAADHRRANLPERAISAEAWVRVDRSQTWGGIVGAVQDNGNDERGWILGSREARFSFALAGQQGNGRLTYLTADREFQRGRWHHVVGTYDGDTMRIYVDGELAGQSQEQRGAIRYPARTFYEIGAYHDSNEYYRLKGAIHEVRVYDAALSADEIARHYAAAVDAFPSQVEAARLARGPWVQFTGPGAASVMWQTHAPSPSILQYQLDGEPQRVEDRRLKRDHRIALSALKHKRAYTYTVSILEDGQERITRAHELDTFFDYTPEPLTGAAGGEADPAQPDYAAAAKAILARSGIDRGICLVLGSAEGRLAWEIAKRSRLRVIGVDTDLELVERSRRWIKARRAYGGRITVHHVNELEALPFVGQFANLVVSERVLREAEPPGTANEVFRVLRPDGGVALLGGPNTAFSRLRPETLRAYFGTGPHRAEIVDDESGVWAELRRGRLPGAGEWTHLYGHTDNSAFAGERLGGASATSELEVQWVGRPGPRYQADRNGRKPSPLSTAGRLFLQGLGRILAVDSFNGTVLWSLEIPELTRFNMPRDCGNWCADRDHVYLAVGDECWRIDAATGTPTDFYAVRPAESTRAYDWGFIARHEKMLVGSAVRAGASWTDFWGRDGWYDARSGPATFQICSDNLFAMDSESGDAIWTWAEGVILNPTITIAEGVVYFVECRNPAVKAADERRVGLPELWQDQYLVALDLDRGTRLWERPIDTVDGTVVFYLAYAKGQLVLVTSSDKKYDVYSFAAADGRDQWHRTFGWPGGKGDHGKAMSRPAIVGDLVYVRPQVLTLKDGQILNKQMPSGGCGTYACSEYALFFRSRTVTMWDRHRAEASTWTRLRPDCWLSTIPANGMLLSPEGGGGCSCGNWMETSVGFMPTAHR